MTHVLGKLAAFKSTGQYTQYDIPDTFSVFPLILRNIRLAENADFIRKFQIK